MEGTGMSSHAVVNTSPHMEAPIMSSYNDEIRPLLDTIDKLRNLNVMEEGIQLPTIVVVGDQSSGKSSVLESLAGISLPRGDGICTRVPLVMRLKRSPSPEPKIWLEFNDKNVDTDEEHIAEAIRAATDEIAGSGYGVSNTPLTLHVEKAGVPDLTMIDLPGITRVAKGGQPENIDEQIHEMIMKYISLQDTIILNVLPASVDFTVCESIRMSKKVDRDGKRTLAVVTKADMAPQGLLEKVTTDDVKIGLGYVCVRNRVGDETYQKARKEEVKLFKKHPMLSKIDDDMVGIPVLAQKLMRIQATMIARCLPDIVEKINDKLEKSVNELSKLPSVITSSGEALVTFMNIIGSANGCLKNFLVQGDFSDFLDDQSMHGTARFADMLSKLAISLQAPPPKDATEFLMDEIKILERCKSVTLPNFLPRPAFSVILSQYVDAIHAKPVVFIKEVWDYIQGVLSSVITKYSENFPQIQSSIKRAGRNLMCKMKEQSVNRVTEIVEMEKMTDYTCNPEYMTVYNQKIVAQESFVNAVRNNSSSYAINAYGFVNVGLSHLWKHDANLLRQAFDMKVRIDAYWTIVVRRMVDNIAMYLQFSVNNLVNREFPKEMEELVKVGGGGGVEKMMEESPSVASKRKKLKNSIKLLKESKEAVAAIVE